MHQVDPDYQPPDPGRGWSAIVQTTQTFTHMSSTARNTEAPSCTMPNRQDLGVSSATLLSHGASLRLHLGRTISNNKSAKRPFETLDDEQNGMELGGS